MYLRGLSDHRYNVTEHVASGGEGDLYAVNGDKYHIVKIYKDPTKFREEKIKAMVHSHLRDSQLLAWPKDVLYDMSGNFRGFLMDRIYGGDPINAIYEIGSRAKYSNVPWSHRVIVAINLCCALNAVHDAGQVIGDFNPKNMFVNMRSGHVKLVDTDSYHISYNGKTYGCIVSMPNYLAPEIAKRLSGGKTLESLKQPTFNESTDNFSLAIHIYQLLMNGAHPYQGAIRPGHDCVLPNIRDNILSGTVPSIDPRSKHLMAPSYAPKFSSLPENMQSLFRRAFLSSKDRPTSKEWHSVLIEYHSSLKQCRKNLVHFYHKELHNCPLCLAEANYMKALGKVSVNRKHNPRLVSYQEWLYPDRDVIDTIAGTTFHEIAEDAIQDQSPVDENLLIDICRRLLPKDTRSKSEMRTELRDQFFHVDDGPFVTYVMTGQEYDRFLQYRRMPEGKRPRSIMHTSFLDIRNAILSVLKERGAMHLVPLISEAEHRLGIRHGSIRSTHRINQAVEVLISSDIIVESNGVYRLA